MQLKDIMLGILVMAIWGFNFVAIRIGLHDMPPILLCALRFILSAFPAIFFFRRPKAKWSLLFGYGIFIFALQFSFLFVGMKLGMPAGLASLIGQFQVFFTMLLAIWFFREKPSRWKCTGAFISFLGILVVIVNFRGGTNLQGLALSLLAALAWSFGNMFSKKISAKSALALVVWGSLVASPLLLALAFMMEGQSVIISALNHISWSSIFAISYIVYLSTYVGYSLWGHLLNKYPTATIAPFSLLVPVFGFLGAFVILGEQFPLWKVFASVLVVLGLAFNLFEKKIRSLL